MNFDKTEIIIFFSKLVTKVINFGLMIGAIIVAGIIVYGFWSFMVEQYAPGNDPKGILEERRKSHYEIVTPYYFS